jgi:O-antigen ligase
MSWAIGFLFLTAPLYIWRFSVFGLPTNFFMLALALVILIGFVLLWQRGLWKTYIDKLNSAPLILKIAVGLFFVASVLSLFVNGIALDKVGQWLVLYLLPIVLGSQIYFFSKQDQAFSSRVRLFIYIFLFINGIVAIQQYFWLWGLPAEWLGNSIEPKRAIGLFAHPNAMALFIAPLLAYLLPYLREKLFKNIGGVPNSIGIMTWLMVFSWIIGVVGLFLSLSRGGWLGLVVAVIMFVIFSRSKKIFIAFVGLVLIAVVVVVSVPNLRYRVLLPFYGEKSSVARISLWETGIKMVDDAPVLGQGIAGFGAQWDKFNTDIGLEHYNSPHNVLINFWVDIGLLGLIAWLLLLGVVLKYWLRDRYGVSQLAVMLFIVTLVVHGLIDTPYLKNDLAFIFWLVYAQAKFDNR